jgi:drug/metabolite transporter (DMT)-like permease
MMTPLALFIEQPWNLPPGITTLMALFGLAAFSTSLAYIIYFQVLAAAGPTNLLLVTFLIPVSAIWLGVVVLDLFQIAEIFRGINFCPMDNYG